MIQLLCLTLLPLSAQFELYRGGQFYLEIEENNRPAANFVT